MDLDDIQKLVEMMGENDLTEVKIDSEGFKVSLKRNDGRVQVSHAPHAMMMPAPAPPTSVAPPPTALAAPTEADGPVDEANHILSPMVGTFYGSPSPEAEPFVQVGSVVTKDTVVCIIEAMKVMNEIKAEKSGVIKKMLVDNATPVQFADPLYVIEPS